CRRLITSNQYPNYSHSTGHGIGLEVHEYPKVSSQSMDVVTANQVFTIEPGIYVAGKWGMRVEDTVTVTLDGRVDILTKYSKETLPIK
ncbi:aminopeptidase P family protein, partial [Candidatus Roizmanbacteria bacterium CG_4_10_14_0_8_um_filter_39_9]